MGERTNELYLSTGFLQFTELFRKKATHIFLKNKEGFR